MCAGIAPHSAGNVGDFRGMSDMKEISSGKGIALAPLATGDVEMTVHCGGYKSISTLTPALAQWLMNEIEVCRLKAAAMKENQP